MLIGTDFKLLFVMEGLKSGRLRQGVLGHTTKGLEMRVVRSTIERGIRVPCEGEQQEGVQCGRKCTRKSVD